MLQLGGAQYGQTRVGCSSQPSQFHRGQVWAHLLVGLRASREYCPEGHWGLPLARLAGFLTGLEHCFGKVWPVPLLPLPCLSSLASPRSGPDVPWSRNSSYLVSQPLAGLSDKANWFSTELVLKGKEEEREKDAHLPHLPVSMTPPWTSSRSFFLTHTGMTEGMPEPRKWEWAKAGGASLFPGFIARYR